MSIMLMGRSNVKLSPFLEERSHGFTLDSDRTDKDGKERPFQAHVAAEKEMVQYRSQ